MPTIAEIKATPDKAVVMMNVDGLITYVNPVFETLFGWTQAEAIGQALTMIIPPKLRDAHNMGFSRFLTTGKPTLLGKALHLKAVTKDGREFEAEHFIVAEQTQGQWQFAATIQPL